MGVHGVLGLCGYAAAFPPSKAQVRSSELFFITGLPLVLFPARHLPVAARLRFTRLHTRSRRAVTGVTSMKGSHFSWVEDGHLTAAAPV